MLRCGTGLSVPRGESHAFRHLYAEECHSLAQRARGNLREIKTQTAGGGIRFAQNLIVVIELIIFLRQLIAVFRHKSRGIGASGSSYSFREIRYFLNKSLFLLIRDGFRIGAVARPPSLPER